MTEKIKKLYNEHRSLILEFIRYCFVGGTAFVFDFLAYWVLIDIIFVPWLGQAYIDKYYYPYAIAITVGFIIGLIINYVLSILWVFTTQKQQEQGKNARAFWIFTIIGIIGYGLKQLLMFIGVNLLGIDDILFNMIAAGIVLIWNYLARKIIVFKK
ncbi:MAG: hypothetical protein A2Y17_08435 [Clostridiales bacterium GWF2_38_85]|nr:MAG: hypothetical protein A2Y17_08435 [Clostridiales bacterium GWF2_38_85]HBL83780.1 GtrA family protein [Clostridiales bacterium]